MRRSETSSRHRKSPTPFYLNRPFKSTEPVFDRTCTTRPTIAASFWNGGGDTLSANRYPSEMVRFVNDREADSQRIGLHCHRENGAYVVIVVDPDGS